LSGSIWFMFGSILFFWFDVRFVWFGRCFDLINVGLACFGIGVVAVKCYDCYHLFHFALNTIFCC